MKAKDLTGQTFGRLFVKEYAGQHIYPSGKTRRQWRCVCLNDGNEVVVNGNDLLNGHTKSCGCLNDELRSERKFVDLSNHMINGFEVMKRIGKQDKNEKWNTSTPIYLARCLNCGRFIEIRADYLRSGDVHSCGCLVKRREKEIEDYFEAHRINYVKGVSFAGLVTDNNCPMYFDFALFGADNILRCVIEEQGIQHKGTNNVVKDNRKRIFCLEHRITLEEIWYNENLEERLNVISEKYLHADPVPSVFDEGATTISKESTRLMKFQRGSAVLLQDVG